MHLFTQLQYCADAEGGADAWARPALPPINPKRDSISEHSTTSCVGHVLSLSLAFQQIDIEDSVEQQTGGTTLRMFGVTQVSPFREGMRTILTYGYRTVIVSSRISQTFFRTSTLPPHEVSAMRMLVLSCGI